MLAPLLLLRVAAAWPLPGLGLLALPDGPTPYLATLALHTALTVEIDLSGGRRRGHATVEEVTRPDAPATVRGLLLDFEGPVEMPPGTEVWLVSTAGA